MLSPTPRWPGIARSMARAITLVELGDAQAAAEAYRAALALRGNAAEDDYLSASLSAITYPAPTAE